MLNRASYEHCPNARCFLRVPRVPALIALCAAVVMHTRVGSAPRVQGPAGKVKDRLDGALAGARRARRRRRVRRVEMAALRAAEGNELLSPEAVRRAAEALLRLVHLAWRARDRRRLATLLGPRLLAELEDPLAGIRRLPGGEPAGEVRVEYVGLHAGGREEPRVVVLIEAALREAVGVRRLCQYWTLGVRDGLFYVLDIEEPNRGRRHLSEPIDSTAAIVA